MMTQQSRQIGAFLILALLSFGIYKYYFDPIDLEQSQPFTKGYSVENIELKITNDMGKLSAKFQSPSIIRYTDNPIIFINSPLFWTYKKGKDQWLLKAQKAEYNSEMALVSLLNEVEAKTTDNTSGTRFVANDLSIDLTTKLAKTANGIQFSKEQLSMSGLVAEFDLENEILSVKNNIKAIYKPIVKK